MCISVLRLLRPGQGLDSDILFKLYHIEYLGQLSSRRLIPSILFILGLFPDVKVSDPRDYVYGYLGILNDLLLKYKIHADYSKTIEEVFHRTSEDIIVQEQDLELLTRQLLEPSCRPRASMPSWVRDWASFEAEFLPMVVPEIEAQLGYEQATSVEGDYLTAQGLIIDSIEDVSDNLCAENSPNIVLELFVTLLFTPEAKTTEDIVKAAEKTSQCCDVRSDDPHRQFSKQAWYTLLSRYLLGSLGLTADVLIQNPTMGTLSKTNISLRKRILGELENSTNIVDLVKSSVILRWLTDQKCTDDELENCALMLNIRLFSSKKGLGVNIFRSTKGFRGIGPAGRNLPGDRPIVRIGDHIALFPTVNRPMILRERSGDGAYILIGTAHVGNIMEIPWYKGDTPKLVPLRIR
jgi:hypothetical protein